MKQVLWLIRVFFPILLLTVALRVFASDSIPGPMTDVRNLHGVPTFYMNGVPYTRPIFETYVPQSKYFKQFADAGCEVHQFSINLGQALHCTHVARPIWIEPDRFDYTQLDQRMEEVFRADPDGYILPRFFIGAPDWWLAAHVDQCVLLHTGKNYYVPPTGNAVTCRRLFPSLASQKWREDTARGIKTVIDHILQSKYGDRLFGIEITGLYTEEWYHWSSNANQLSDYSDPFRQGFGNWLRQRYGSDESLQKAWSDERVTFDTVEVPSKPKRVKGRNDITFRDPITDMPVIDYYLYYNEVMPETIEYFCKAAKEACGNQKVVGSFYGFMFEFAGNPEFGHNAMDRFNASPWIDFMVVTASYHNRLIGKGADYVRSPATSVQLHDKVWYHDNDTLSFLYLEVMLGGKMHIEAQDREEAEYQAARIGAPRTLEETLAQYRRTAGFCLAWGMHPTFFDLHGGYFDHPELMAEVERLTTILADAKNYDRSSLAEILVVSDEPSCSYMTFSSELSGQVTNGPQVALCKIGAPHDSILIHDLDRVDMDRYKLVIFLNTFHMTNEQRQWIDEKVKGDGRTVVWCYAPGLFNGSIQSVAAMQDLTGLRIVPMASEQFVKPQIRFSAEEHPLSERLVRAGVSVVGPDRASCKLFYVEPEPRIQALGVFPGSSHVTAALRDLGDWNSVYFITPDLPAAVYRELARMAGVHLYNERDDAFYMNNSYITISTDGAGPRTLELPFVCDVFDPLTGEKLYSNVRSIERDLRDRETVLLRYERR